MQWCVYDNNSDEVIGVWNDLNQAEAFWFDHSQEDDWCIFPWDEVIVPSNV